MTLTQDKKITVIFRIEPGCLGPDGRSHVAAFCHLASNQLAESAPEFMNWRIEPRLDKTLPELAYALQSRPLSREHATRYFAYFGEQIDHFEVDLLNRLPDLIDQYFGR